jgi:predicted secreted protein
MIKCSLSNRARCVMFVVAGASLSLLLGGCGSTVKTGPTVHSTMIDGENTQDATVVDKGETLTIRLPTCGGTQFTWRPTPESVDNQWVTLQERYEKQFPYGGLAGNGEPAYDVFVFKANHTGHVSLKFLYEHQYTTNVIPARMVALDVNVVQQQKGTTMASAQ